MDVQSIVVDLMLPYVASALSVASMVGVFKWLVAFADGVAFLSWLPALFLKAPGEKKLRPAQVKALRGLVFLLSGIGAWRGAVVPLGGAAAGVFGLVGATCLVAMLAMGAREALRKALVGRKQAT